MRRGGGAVFGEARGRRPRPRVRWVVSGMMLVTVLAPSTPAAQIPSPPRDGELDCLIQPREVVAISSPISVASLRKRPIT